MFKGVTPLIIALVLALGAAFAAYMGIRNEQKKVEKEWKTTAVVVASQDIPEGTVLTMEMISQRQVPEQFVTASVVRPGSADAVINQKVVVPLQRGDPLLWTQFETTRMQQRLSTMIEKRGRVVTIEATANSSGVGGWVRPNDHVDVLGIIRDPQTNQNTAVTILQNAIVLATGKITGTTNVNLLTEQQREYQNVSLMVLPEEAEVLALAQELGTLTLSLRNEDDTDTIESGRTTINTLLNGERQKALNVARQKTFINIIRGGEKASPAVPTRGAQ